MRFVELRPTNSPKISTRPVNTPRSDIVVVYSVELELEVRPRKLLRIARVARSEV